MKSFDNSCPICQNGNVTRKFEKKVRTFRKEDFELFESYIKCAHCNEEYTTTEIDIINTNQVYNKYREKYSIPFPEQLTFFREKYELSAAKMSEILGFGANQYRLYENGEIPSPSNATLLNLVMDPESFLEIVTLKKDVVKNLDKVLRRLDEIISTERTVNLKQILFNENKIPTRYTGYSITNFQKFANMVLFFLDNAPYQVRLNKFLFYADFLNYKSTGKSISGYCYAAIDMGPVPDNYYYLMQLLKNEGIIDSELKYGEKDVFEKFKKKQDLDKSIFSADELSSMETVLNYFKYKKTKEIIEISHQEVAWTDNHNTKSLIDYSTYAPQLKIDQEQ